MPPVELITKVPEHDSELVPARSVRRATARRASNRRATARSRQGDIQVSIIDFLAQHPASTAGDLAKGLDLNPGSVSTPPRASSSARSRSERVGASSAAISRSSASKDQNDSPPTCAANRSWRHGDRAGQTGCHLRRRTSGTSPKRSPAACARKGECDRPRESRFPRGGGRWLTMGRCSSCSESRRTRTSLRCCRSSSSARCLLLLCDSSVSASPERRSCGAGRPPRGRWEQTATLPITEVERSQVALGRHVSVQVGGSVCLPAARCRSGSASG